VRGRKRHLLLVNTEGLVMKAKVHSAKVPDQDGLRLLLECAGTEISSIKHLWLDAGYQGRGKRWAEEEVLGLSVEVVRKPLRSPSLRRWRGFGPRSGPRRARRSIGKGSCRREAFGCCRGGGGREDLLVDRTQ
jgi:hypothetical protein